MDCESIGKEDEYWYYLDRRNREEGWKYSR